MTQQGVQPEIWRAPEGCCPAAHPDLGSLTAFCPVLLACLQQRNQPRLSMPAAFLTALAPVCSILQWRESIPTWTGYIHHMLQCRWLCDAIRLLQDKAMDAQGRGAQE